MQIRARRGRSRLEYTAPARRWPAQGRAAGLAGGVVDEEAAVRVDAGGQWVEASAS